MQEIENKPAVRWWVSPRAIFRQLLQLNDTSHSIAMGATVGVFVGLTPTVGVQMIIVMIVAMLTGWFFRFNRIAALIATYISNPITTLPIFWFSYKVGTIFLPATVNHQQFVEILHYESLSQWCETMWNLLIDVGWPLLLGSLIIAPVGAIITYPTMRYLLKNFQMPSRQIKTSPQIETEADDSSKVKSLQVVE